MKRHVGEGCSLRRSTAGVRETEDFDGAGGSALPATRPSIGSGRKANGTRLEFNSLPGVRAACHHCNKLVKDKQLNGTLLTRHLYNCAKCSLTVWQVGGGSSVTVRKKRPRRIDSKMAVDGDALMPPPASRAYGQPTGTTTIHVQVVHGFQYKWSHKCMVHERSVAATLSITCSLNDTLIK